ncbi:threonine aldolase family protein [Terriglobus tenax]|uniref:threonine aldolase family protein n=1 Tax=Terriglobus tenax TaxID=1111115 RepID=UPI0021DF625D|nr:GntG family PLP-dependent aldolase [Terriglobus tenax]
MEIIELRSDTLTKPTAAMRQAMATAEVGDDVYGEDPTINKLEARAAQVFGKEAAIFVPTGSMGNLTGIMVHARPGQEVICESRAHILDWEMGSMCSVAGTIPRTVYGDRGILTWAQIREKITLDTAAYYRARTGLIELENSHNMAGGTVTPLDVYEEIWAGAKENGVPTHLDGARVFNAATALGVSVSRLTSGFDTVMFCLSKGLCAPVGSMLVGSKASIERARVIRKTLGGGMRQAGVLAAAGLIALEEMSKRLAEDHANARLLAEAIAASPAAEIDLAGVQTNIVIFRLKNQGDAAGLVNRLGAKGIRMSAIGPHAVRLVTHNDVTRAQCETAAKVIVEELGA